LRVLVIPDTTVDHVNTCQSYIPCNYWFHIPCYRGFHIPCYRGFHIPCYRGFHIASYCGFHIPCYRGFLSVAVVVCVSEALQVSVGGPAAKASFVATAATWH